MGIGRYDMADDRPNAESGHEPVLLREVVAALDPQPGGRFIDGTVGAGGHAAALLAGGAPDGLSLIHI